MHPTQPNESEAGSFPLLVMLGLGAIILGFALPVFGGDGSQSVFESDAEGATTTLALFGIPIVLGAISGRRSPLLTGIAAGAALLLGSTLAFVWALTLGIISASEGGSSIGGGLAFMAIGSVLLVIAAMTSARMRRVGMEPGASHSPVARLGVVAAIVTVVGAMIPPEGVDFDAWAGFADYPIFGVAFLVVLATFVYVGIGGFLGGRWGIGLVVGFAGVLLIANLLSDSSESFLGDLVRTDQEPHVLANVGFFSMVGLMVIHAIQVLGSSPGASLQTAGVGALADVPAANTNPPRWADDPFDRHQSRYWNGRKWTDQVADNGVVGTDPAVATPQPPAAAPPATASPFAPPGVVAPLSTSFDQSMRDGQTVSRADLPTRSQPSVGSVALVFDSGQRTTLGGPLLIGRDPAALAQVPGATCVSVSDPSMSVSKTHFAIGPDAAGVWIEDVGSANGTSVTAPSGEEFDLIPGSRMSVPIGSSVRFGERTFVVEQLS